MLFVHAPGYARSYPTDKASLKEGRSYELYVYRAPRFVATGVAFFFVMCSAAFLVYAVFSKIPDLWIYAAAATGVTSFLTCLSLYLAFTLNYERISLAGAFANAYACQHSLLVVRDREGSAEGWFAAGFVLFTRGKESHLHATADFRKVDPKDVADNASRRKARMASVLHRRSFVQTDSTDLRDYLRCAALKNQQLLARKAGLAVRRG